MAFTPEWVFFDRPATAVETNLTTMNQRADRAISTAEMAISSLGSFRVDSEPTAPDFTLPPIATASAVTPTAPSNTKFGSITDLTEPPSSTVAVDYSDALSFNPGKFTPTVGVPTIGAMGKLDTSGGPGPVPPVVGVKVGGPFSASPPKDLVTETINISAFKGISLPPEPGWVTITPTPFGPVIPPDPLKLDTISITPFKGIDIPPDPRFLDIVVPSFAGIVDPGFVDTQPTFTGVAPQFTFAKPATYVSSMQGQILAWINGQGGLPAAVQQALFDAARSREDQSALAAEQEAFDTFAGRGWMMPPGMLVETMSVAQERSRFARSTANRDIASKVAELAVENIRAAVAAGVALESALIASYDHTAQLTFEAAKGQADIEARLFDAAVALYNANQSARQVSATIYRAKLEGELAKVQVFKSQADVEIAKGQLNDGIAKVYQAKIEAKKADADAYKSTVAGETAKASLNDARARAYTAAWGGETARIDANKALNQAEVAKASINDNYAKMYSSQIEAKLAEAKTYEAQVQGEIAKGTVNDQRARAYVAGWDGVKAAAEAYSTGVRGSQIAADTERTSVEAYAASVRAWSETVAVRKLEYDAFADQARVEAAKGSIYEAEARAFAETVRAQEAQANVKLKLGDVKIAAYRAETERYQAKIEFQKTKVQAELANIDATAKAFMADTGRYAEELKGANQMVVADIQTAELRLRNNLAHYEGQLKEYDSSLARQIERSKLILEALKASGQIGATLAAGAMSAIHVQASISGDGKVESISSLQRTQKLADAPA